MPHSCVCQLYKAAFQYLQFKMTAIHYVLASRRISKVIRLLMRDMNKVVHVDLCHPLTMIQHDSDH